MAQRKFNGNGPGTTTTDRQSLGQLVASATQDLGALVRGEIQLAKAELQSSAIAAVKGSALFIVAALLVGMAFFMLCFAAAYGLVAAGLPEWLAFLIVAVVFLLVAALIAWLGLRSLKKIGPPTLTIESVQEAKELVTRSDSSDAADDLDNDLDDDDPDRPSRPDRRARRAAGDLG
ncbi:phage holin family protein [Flindersiella endophytica]